MATACQSTSYDTRIERELVNELPSENIQSQLVKYKWNTDEKQAVVQ